MSMNRFAECFVAVQHRRRAVRAIVAAVGTAGQVATTVWQYRWPSGLQARWRRGRVGERWRGGTAMKLVQERVRFGFGTAQVILDLAQTIRADATFAVAARQRQRGADRVRCQQTSSGRVDRRQTQLLATAAQQEADEHPGRDRQRGGVASPPGGTRRSVLICIPVHDQASRGGFVWAGRESARRKPSTEVLDVMLLSNRECGKRATELPDGSGV